MVASSIIEREGERADGCTTRCLAGLLGVVGILWRINVSTKRDLNRHLDHQVEALKEGQAGLAKDVAGLKEGQAGLARDVAGLGKDVAGLTSSVAGLEKGQAELKDGQARLGENIIQLAGGLGEVRGELKRIAPREKVGAGGS